MGWLRRWRQWRRDRQEAAFKAELASDIAYCRGIIERQQRLCAVLYRSERAKGKRPIYGSDLSIVGWER
jgi:hypothetical protein